MKFLLLDKSEAGNMALALLIRSCLDPPLDGEAVFCGYGPEDVFKAVLPKDAAAAFITIGGIEDLEAAKQFSRLYEDIPLVAVSSGEDYSAEASRLGARYYIKRPMLETEIREALRRCAIRSAAEDGCSVTQP